jgi:hypothetical protein
MISMFRGIVTKPLILGDELDEVVVYGSETLLYDLKMAGSVPL